MMSNIRKSAFDKNIDRVNSLCAVYRSLKTTDAKEGKDYKFTDVLRSAVVCLHSSFEEYFRSVLKEVMPTVCTRESLQHIQFLTKEGKHFEKISVNDLIQYKDKKVDELIADFISETLNTTSFNNYTDIVNWAKKINVDLSKFESKDKINKMIERRHKIVHEADNNRAGESSDTYSLTPIKENVVSEWISAIQSLVNIINEQIGGSI